MVVDMQERKLVVLFTKDEEEGVAEFQQLGEVVPPNSIDNLTGFSLINNFITRE